METKKITKIVLDTSIFVNPDSHRFFGRTPYQALIAFLDTINEKKGISYYIPPSVFDELMKFMEENIPAQKIIHIQKKPPSSYTSDIPALLFYEFIEEMRARINKGLRIAEKYARKEPAKKEGETIKSLREEYRTGVREGIIDSKEDFDLILLAHELHGCLATSDNGLIKWAYKLGIPCINAQELKEVMA